MKASLSKREHRKNKEKIMAYQSINLLNGELLQKFDQHTDAQMESALAEADSTFQNVWSKASFRDRAKVVGKAASLMLERKEQLARLAAIEMGKRISEGRDGKWQQPREAVWPMLRKRSFARCAHPHC